MKIDQSRLDKIKKSARSLSGRWYGWSPRQADTRFVFDAIDEMTEQNTAKEKSVKLYSSLLNEALFLLSRTDDPEFFKKALKFQDRALTELMDAVYQSETQNGSGEQKVQMWKVTWIDLSSTHCSGVLYLDASIDTHTVVRMAETIAPFDSFIDELEKVWVTL